ncbi:TraB/GumN family protein [Flavobacterium sp.]|uniref:TraB/GumN family protein n=1 Tax=Flavobacterium sp. TaxID=239 RepID=UPI0040477C9D
MKKLLFLTLLSSCFLFGQQENNLLWEISKKGSEKKSFVYGTMHVNDKISYHLSDAFFEALLNVEVVANESNPETWGDLTNLMYSRDLNSAYKLYTEFYLDAITKDEVKTLFNTNTTYFDNVISGNNNNSADYQEDTVLDMFIFQTGKKYNKTIMGLEDAKTSLIPIYKLTEEEAKPKEENKSILLKMLKNKNLNEFIKESYREKNIVILDSLYKLMISPKAHDALIVSRNKIMADSMEKIMQDKSLFAAIGAAHLAGKEGVIQLLKEKGYTVKPVSTELSEIGKDLKKTIETNFPKPTLHKHSTADNMISLSMNKYVVTDKYSIGSPDYTNGGVIKIIRKPVNNFLSKKGEYNYKSLDSLFFENIPGTIHSKKLTEEKNFTRFEIDNETKTGNSQHFNFYITPLEIISVSLTGAKNYAKLYSKDIFESIQLKEFSNEWQDYSPTRGGFNVKIPSYFIVYGENTTTPENIELQAYKDETQSYFFVTERNLNTLHLLENKEFEEKQMQEEFFIQHEIKPTFSINSRKKTQGKATLNKKEIVLESFIFGNKYYLLGAVNATAKDKETFFNSFVEKPFIYKDTLEVYTDTISKFSVKIPRKLNEKLFYGIGEQKTENKNIFNVDNKYLYINAENGKKINLEYYKFHKYDNFKNLDSIKSNLKHYFTKFYTHSDDAYYENDYDYVNNNSVLSFSVYSKKGFKRSNWYEVLFEDKEREYTIIKETTSENKENKTVSINYLVSKEGSNQAIKSNVLFREDAYIVTQVLVDKDYNNDDEFIETVFSSLAFNDEPKNSIFEGKIDEYIKDAYNEKDTIRYSALNSTHELKILESDIPKVIEFLNEFSFKATEITAQNSLLNKLASIDDERIIPFLENYYKRENAPAEIQLNILKALTFQKSKKGYQKIMELLEYDLPLSNSEYDISSLFYTFLEDKENSKELFPKIFQFYSIPEYNEPLINFCNELIETKHASASKLKSFRKMILTNAKLEYKRVLSWKIENTEYNDDDKDEYLADQQYAPVDELIGYLNLLEHFKNNNETQEFITKLKKLDILALDIEIMRLSSLNNTLTESDKKEILSDPKKAFLLMQLENNTYDFSETEIANFALNNFYDVKKNDSIVFLQKKLVDCNNHKITFFFYKITEKEPKNYEDNLCSFAFVTKNNKLELYTYRYLRSTVITDEDKIETDIETIINQTINEPHLRASFKKRERNSNINYLYDDY